MPRRSTEIIHQSSHKPPKKRNWRTATRKNKKNIVCLCGVWCVCVCLSALWPFACVLSSSRVLVALHCNWPRLVSFHAHFHDLAKLKASTRSPTLPPPHHHPTTTTTTICPFVGGKGAHHTLLFLSLLPLHFFCLFFCLFASSANFANKQPATLSTNWGFHLVHQNCVCGYPLRKRHHVGAGTGAARAHAHHHPGLACIHQ